MVLCTTGKTGFWSIDGDWLILSADVCLVCLLRIVDQFITPLSKEVDEESTVSNMASSALISGCSLVLEKGVFLSLLFLQTLET